MVFVIDNLLKQNNLLIGKCKDFLKEYCFKAQKKIKDF